MKIPMEPCGLAAIFGQRRPTGQIGNLLINSIQAMDGNGEVRVELPKDPEHDLLFFRDNGSDVKVEHRDMLFEPLFTTKAKGTGLRLAICRQIVECHAHDYWCALTAKRLHSFSKALRFGGGLV